MISGYSSAGRALRPGRKGREFKSHYSDHIIGVWPSLVRRLVWDQEISRVQIPLPRPHDPLAQLVEHLTLNQRVSWVRAPDGSPLCSIIPIWQRKRNQNPYSTGSNPVWSTTEQFIPRNREIQDRKGGWRYSQLKKRLKKTNEY